MVLPDETKLMRVSLTLDPVDVDLLDRLAKLEGANRSIEVRGILESIRPTLRATVEAFEAAIQQRDEFVKKTAQQGLEDLQELMPEMERIQTTMLGALSRLEGAATARAAENPRGSNHGGHNSLEDMPNTSPGGVSNEN